MIGTKGYKMREAAAFRKNRSQRLTTEEVRAARFANLHGNAEAPAKPIEEIEAVEPAASTEQEVAAETPAEQTDVADEAAEQAADEAGEDAGDEAGDEGDEGEGEADAGADKSTTTVSKKKAKGKAKK